MLHQREDRSSMQTGLGPGFKDMAWTNIVSRTASLLPQHIHPCQQFEKGMLIQLEIGPGKGITSQVLGTSSSIDGGHEP